MNRTLVPLLTGTLLALVACRRATPTAETRPAPSASADAARPPLARSTSPRPTAAPSGSAPMSAAEQAATRRYLEALAQGRARARKKDFAGAVASLDQALQALPGDARALAERGFARLQTGDLDGAENDMHAALKHAPDRSVLSATTYNLALVAERRGNKALADELREAARANRRPASAAGACEPGLVRITNGAEDPDLKHLTTLRQVRAELAAYAEAHLERIEPPLPTTDDEDELRRLLLGDRPGPWDLVTEESHHLLVGQPGAYRLQVGVITPRYGRCGSYIDTSLRIVGGFPVASTVYREWSMHSMCLSPSKGEVHDCGSTDATDEEPAGSACFGPTTYTWKSVVYDPKTGQALLAVNQERTLDKDNDPTDWTRLLPRADGVQLLGGGCNRFEPFEAPPAASARP